MRSIFFIMLFVPLTTAAQIFDDFSDGDFTNNPTWIGTDSLFEVSLTKQLQLNAKSEGKAWLSVDYGCYEDTEWHFWIKENYSPSSKNYCDIYLYSDKTDISSATYGYFLRFGEAGNNDVIDLMRLDGNITTSICRGIDTFISSPFSTFVKVIHYKSGYWEVFIDKTGSGIYQREAYGNDSTFQVSDHFGILANYTAGNATKLFFDDFYVGPRTIDTIPPKLLSCNILDKNHLQLIFNEGIDELKALDINNYTIDNQLNNPSDVTFGNDRSTIILKFNDIIQEGIYYTLNIKCLEDISGNYSENITYTFLYYNAHENDIVINEIMADPAPQVELPSWEYIELYNTCDFPIDITNWTFIIGTSEKKIEQNIVIQPNNYLLLCHEDAIEDLSHYGYCHGFPSFQIANNGTHLSLVNETNELISDIDFNISWYHDHYKEEGGWSLEEIDPNNPCAGKDNWRASVEKAGGTPGSVNSVNAPNILRPNFEHVNILSNRVLEIYFDQKMNITSLQNIESYTVIEMQAHPSDILTLPSKTNYVKLLFSQEFEPGRLYTISIDNLLNCKDLNQEETLYATFGIPEYPDSNDLIINEILFNPISPGVDYLEIYNRSDKIIDLSKIFIGSIKKNFPNPPDTIIKEICSESRLFLPHNYILLSTDSDVIGHQYNIKLDNFFDMISFPPYPNEEGEAIICTKNKSIIDKMYYSEKMHYDLLMETQGVALERISFENSSLELSNWHSAASNVNYGTPGYKNSISFDPEFKDTNDKIYVAPEIFSPDGDGYNDITGIYYNLDDIGYTLNINIFDSNGHLVRHLLRNNLVNQQGMMTWDGCNDNNNRIPPGIYIVLTEVFNLKGTVKRYKNAVVIATK